MEIYICLLCNLKHFGNKHPAIRWKILESECVFCDKIVTSALYVEITPEMKKSLREAKIKKILD
jgi:hypothetical protein